MGFNHWHSLTVLGFALASQLGVGHNTARWRTACVAAGAAGSDEHGCRAGPSSQRAPPDMLTHTCSPPPSRSSCPPVQGVCGAVGRGALQCGGYHRGGVGGREGGGKARQIGGGRAGRREAPQQPTVLHPHFLTLHPLPTHPPRPAHSSPRCSLCRAWRRLTRTSAGWPRAATSGCTSSASSSRVCVVQRASTELGRGLVAVEGHTGQPAAAAVARLCPVCVPPRCGTLRPWYPLFPHPHGIPWYLQMSLMRA